MRGGFFNGAPFFRVIQNFMAQFGIAVKPEENKTWEARKLLDDKPTGHPTNAARWSSPTPARPNTRGTQMFINYKDNTFLDSQAAPFLPIGEVVEGMEIVDQFYSGYGDTANKEGEIENGGKAYLDRYMPKVDLIQTATIVPMPKPRSRRAPTRSNHAAAIPLDGRRKTEYAKIVLSSACGNHAARSLSDQRFSVLASAQVSHRNFRG